MAGQVADASEAKSARLIYGGRRIKSGMTKETKPASWLRQSVKSFIFNSVCRSESLL
jgi:hypothetical protein